MARRRDNSSKIYNLLKGSVFEEYRSDTLIEFVSAKKIFNMLESTKVTDIIKFRDINLSVFDKNLTELLNAISK